MPPPSSPSKAPSLEPNGRGFHTLAEQVEGLRTYSANPQQRIRTGFNAIDMLCEGPAPGEVFTFLGRSYSGKSIVAQNIMVNNASLGIIFFSLEMFYLIAIQRQFAMWSGFDNSEVAKWTREGTLPDLIDVMPDEFEKQVIVDRAGMTPEAMSHSIDQYFDWFGSRPDCVIVDYLELVSGAKVSGEGWLATESSAQSMKDFAKQEAMPVFLIHQTNKAEDPWEAPTMGSARGGGYTEADFVVGMWRPHLNPKLTYFERELLRSEIHFTILKNRPFGKHNDRPLQYRMRPDLILEEA